MDERDFEHIIANTVLTGNKDAKVVLYGSRARGDYRADSDWDVLVIIDKERITEEDHRRIAFPLYDLGIDYNTLISPKIYTKTDWEKRSFTPFYKNVINDGRVLS